jgi:hypothetical protein
LAALRGQAGNIDDVLDPDGDAVQRPANPAALEFVRQPLGLFAGSVAIEDDPGVHVRFIPINPREALVEQIDRRERSGPHRGGGVIDG